MTHFKRFLIRHNLYEQFLINYNKGTKNFYFILKLKKRLVDLYGSDDANAYIRYTDEHDNIFYGYDMLAAFVFESTPEGNEFWHKVAKQYKRFYEQNIQPHRIIINN